VIAEGERRGGDRAGPGCEDSGVEIPQALDFVRANHRGVLATGRADGKPQLSPVSATVDATGRVVISSRETAYKVRHLRARPYASYCGFPDGFFGSWVQVEGPVEVISLPDAMQPLIECYRSIAGEHPDWADYRAAMERDQRVIIAITPERAGPTVSG
jgi:PPOX class probable F420-dependent enzyme